MKIKTLKLFCLLLIVHSFAAFGEHLMKDENNTALNGYDAVSYYREKLAVKGDETINAKFLNSTWFFRDSSNLKTFLKNPAKFVPQYGGYCAYGTRFGVLVESDPKVFALIDRKLYFITDTGSRKKWRDDLSENIERADKKWGKIKLKKYPKIQKREIELASD